MQIYRLAFSPDGRELAVSIGDYVKIIDMASHKEIASFGKYLLRPSCFAFSPNGRYLAAGIEDGEIHIYESTSK